MKTEIQLSDIQSNNGCQPCATRINKIFDMKNLILLIVIAMGTISFGQTRENEETISKTKETVQSEDGRPVYVNTGNPEEDQKRYDEAKTIYLIKKGELPNPNDAIREEIKIVEGNINAIQTKMEHVKNDPEALKVAQDNGWFESMEGILKRLKEKKTNLESSINTNY